MSSLTCQLPSVSRPAVLDRVSRACRSILHAMPGMGVPAVYVHMLSTSWVASHDLLAPASGATSTPPPPWAGATSWPPAGAKTMQPTHRLAHPRRVLQLSAATPIPPPSSVGDLAHMPAAFCGQTKAVSSAETSRMEPGMGVPAVCAYAVNVMGPDMTCLPLLQGRHLRRRSHRLAATARPPAGAKTIAADSHRLAHPRRVLQHSAQHPSPRPHQRVSSLTCQRPSVARTKAVSSAETSRMEPGMGVPAVCAYAVNVMGPDMTCLPLLQGRHLPRRPHRLARPPGRLLEPRQRRRPHRPGASPARSSTQRATPIPPPSSAGELAHMPAAFCGQTKAVSSAETSRMEPGMGVPAVCAYAVNVMGPDMTCLPLLQGRHLRRRPHRLARPPGRLLEPRQRRRPHRLAHPRRVLQQRAQHPSPRPHQRVSSLTCQRPSVARPRLFLLLKHPAWSQGWGCLLSVHMLSTSWGQT